MFCRSSAPPNSVTSMMLAASALPFRDGEPDQKGNDVGDQYAE
jgi:hypothetical protein